MVKTCFLAILLPLLVHNVAASVHSYGIKNTYTTSFTTVMTKELYRSNLTVPRNYTIIFRYLFADLLPISISYAEISVENNLSQGDFEVNTKNKTIAAKITIPNGVNVVVTFSMESYGASFLDIIENSNFFDKIRDPNGVNSPQSFTVVHIQDAKKPKETTFTHNAVGQRQINDRLLYFSSQNVTNLSNFASNAFEFLGTDGQAISYVGFSFDSPTAVAYLDSRFILENQFSAVVYDLSMSRFTANMSVFGYENGEKPEGFQPIVRFQ